MYSSVGKSSKGRTKKFIVFGILLLILNFVYLYLFAPPNLDIYGGVPHYSIIDNFVKNGVLSFPIFKDIFRTTPLLLLGLCWIFIAPFSKFLLNKKDSDRKIISLFIFFSLLIVVASVFRVWFYPDYSRLLTPSYSFTSFLYAIFMSSYSPVIPFAVFLFAGVYFGKFIIIMHRFEKYKKILLNFAFLLFISGIIGAIFAPGRIIKMQTDYVWASDILIGYSFCLICIILLVSAYDLKCKRLSWFSRLINDFGFISLTIFIFEGVVAGLVAKIWAVIYPNWGNSKILVSFFALGNVFVWYGLILLWKKVNYKFSIEYCTVRFYDLFGLVSKKLVTN
jgi:hypothetical protein